MDDGLSSRRVLTTSWIQGTKLRDPQELRPNGLIRSSDRTGVISGLQQLLEFGYFRDPIPEICLRWAVAPGLGHVAYVDFGMMDSITMRTVSPSRAQWCT